MRGERTLRPAKLVPRLNLRPNPGHGGDEFNRLGRGGGDEEHRASQRLGVRRGGVVRRGERRAQGSQRPGLREDVSRVGVTRRLRRVKRHDERTHPHPLLPRVIPGRLDVREGVELLGDDADVRVHVSPQVTRGAHAKARALPRRRLRRRGEISESLAAESNAQVRQEF